MSHRHLRIGDSLMLTLPARAAVDAGSSNQPSKDPLLFKRQLVADLCKLIGSQLVETSAPSSKSLSNSASPDNELPHLSPRMRQTLNALLQGDSEKQIAQKLSLSKHTIHVYVKALYRGFSVNSRGELLARFVNRRITSPV